MEKGSDLSKTVSTFILQRILMNKDGLSYICNTADRFMATTSVLLNMLTQNPSQRLSKHITKCYTSLADNTRARQTLRENFSNFVKDNRFDSLEESTKKWVLNYLKHNLNMISSNNIDLQKPGESNPLTFNSGGVNLIEKKTLNKTSI
jgi:CCR4-NOT transcription complex subunit 9